MDESGNTGNNLFDLSQPVLYYGVLSSRVNLDLLALPYISAIKKKLNVERLHAVDLSEGRLVLMAPTILKMIKEYGLTFDFYRVIKSDYALIAFFDQVFDSGNNPAVAWSTYSTPMRYAMILNLTQFFDKETLRKAWSARIESDSKKAAEQLIDLCQDIKDRLSLSSDERLKQVVGDALQWAQDNPEAIQYNASTREQLLQISPNLIGFQYVLFGLASRLIKNKKAASKIVLDRQIQFNEAQQSLVNLYLKFPKEPVDMGFGLPVMDCRGMPNTPITVVSSKESAGLELVDIFLWIFKRYSEHKELPAELMPVITSQLHRGKTDELSLQGIFKRWHEWYANRPDVSAEDLESAKELLRAEEERRLRAVRRPTE